MNGFKKLAQQIIDSGDASEGAKSIEKLVHLICVTTAKQFDSYATIAPYANRENLQKSLSREAELLRDMNWSKKS